MLVSASDDDVVTVREQPLGRLKTDARVASGDYDISGALHQKIRIYPDCATIGMRDTGSAVFFVGGDRTYNYFFDETTPAAPGGAHPHRCSQSR